MASLKFLWTYAQKISVNSGKAYNVQSENARTECLAMFSQTKFDNRNSDKKDYTSLVELSNTAKYVIDNYGKSKSGTGRKYLIIGLIMHLLGDVTAHRTVVPQFMVNRATNSSYSNSVNRFNKSDFSTTEWNRITSLVSANNLDFTNITTTYSSSATYCVLDSSNNGSTRISSLRSRYEDNPNVVPNRILQSETMVNYFLHYFSSGFDISIFDNIPYSNVKLIYYSNKYKLQI